jgi:hypothetical protein
VWRWLGLDASAPLVDVGKQNSGELHRGRLVEQWLPRFGGDRAAAEAELERSITPSAEQVEQIKSLLEPDLSLFREEWGIDVWTGQRTERALPQGV